jgi:hypothetical protein
MAMPLLPRGNKSVLTSLLEREPVMSPKYQWNFLDPLRSLEIVWGNGEKLWSGSGVFRGEKEEDWELGLAPVQGPGPGQLDFYKLVSAAQGIGEMRSLSKFAQALLCPQPEARCSDRIHV